ncbi:MAG TPA: BON domain-containing protein [Hymenobacter sp.]
MYAQLVPHRNTLRTTPAAPLCLTDACITAAVELLLMRKGVCTHLEEVKCHDGIVELRGFTDRLLWWERAADMAKSVHGVRGVINKIGIGTPVVADAELQRRVAEALCSDGVAQQCAVCCHARHGELTVAGSLPSEAAVQAVLRVLKGVPGVRQINNRLWVQSGGATPTDEDISARMRGFLARHSRPHYQPIHCRTTGGVVYLEGTAGTTAERDQLVAAAYQAGAGSVDARLLMVAYWPAAGQRQ